MNLLEVAILLYLVPVSSLHQETTKRPGVEVDYDHRYDFAQLSTYAWSNEQQPATNRADHIRITKAVSDKLQELELSLDTNNPEVQILYRLEQEQQKLHVNSRQRDSVWDPTDLETTIALGGHKETYLVVEMVDSETGQRIWRAKCAHLQPTPDKVERSLYETVDHLFEAYPANEEKDE